MKTVRSFANEEEEAEVFLRKLQQVYKLNRKEAAAYMSYVWGSGVCVADTRGERMGVQIEIPHLSDSPGPPTCGCFSWKDHSAFLLRPLSPYKVAGSVGTCILRLARVQPRSQPLPREWRKLGLSLSQKSGR